MGQNLTAVCVPRPIQCREVAARLAPQLPSECVVIDLEHHMLLSMSFADRMLWQQIHDDVTRLTFERQHLERDLEHFLGHVAGYRVIVLHHSYTLFKTLNLAPIMYCCPSVALMQEHGVTHSEEIVELKQRKGHKLFVFCGYDELVQHILEPK